MSGTDNRKPFEGTMVDQWAGDPVFWKPVYCNDELNTWRVFHRDKPGRIIAEFYGDNARTMAERFCELFGEVDGSKVLK